MQNQESIKTTVTAINNNYTLAYEWIINSGIHFVDASQKFDAFYEAYNKHKKQYSFLYYEITGYAVNFLLNLFKKNKDSKILALAKRAGDFLVLYQAQQGSHRGAGPWTVTETGESHHLHYTFDAAMGMSGLADLYKFTQDEKYLKSAVMAADWLINEAQNPDGSFKSVYDSKQAAFDSQLLENDWSGDRGCLHIKHIRGLAKVQALTGKQELLEGMDKTMRWSQEIQKETGAFPARADQDYIFTHAHCYALEGLISAYPIFKENKILEAFLKAVEWLVAAQNPDGSFYDYYGLPGLGKRLSASHNILRSIYHGTITVDSNRIIRLKRSDATAQAARIFCISYTVDQQKKYLQAAEKAMGFISDMQSKDSSREENGAVCFGCLDLGGFKKRSALYPAWSSMFAGNAYEFLELMHTKENISCTDLLDRLF